MMKRSLCLFLAAVFGMAAVVVGEGFPWVAAGGPNGIYVNLGNRLPGRGGVAAYVLERREIGGAAWDTVARRIGGPTSAGEFAVRLKDAERVIDPVIPRQSRGAEALWEKVRRGETLNFLKRWGGALAVRMALGVTVLDSTAARGNGYEYRVTTLQPNGRVAEVITSKSVLWPGTAPQIRLASMRRENDEHIIRIVWSAGSSRTPAVLKAVRGDVQGTLSLLDKASLILQRSHGDSLTLMLVDTAVTPGSRYRYSVETWDYYGNPGPAADTVLAAALPFHRVALPHHIAVESSDSLHGLYIQWKVDDPKNIQNVKLWRSEQHDTGFAVIAALPSSTTNYVDQTAESMRKYFFCLTITSALGEESPRSARVFGIFRDHTPPLAPGLREGSSVKGGVGLVVTRTDRAAAAFRIYRCDGLGTPFVPISPLLPFADSEVVFVDTGRALKPLLAYGYTAQAENAAHTAGPRSDTVYARADISLELHAPPALTATIDESNHISLFWPDARPVNPAMTGYLVFRKSGRAEFEPVDTVPLGTSRNWYTDTAAVTGGSYLYCVRCVDAAGNRSAPSPVAAVQLPRRLPLPPASVRALVFDGGVEISFDEPLDTMVTGYLVYRYERGKTPAVIAKLAKGKATFTDRDGPAGTLRFYYVTSAAADGIESEPSGEVGVRR